MTNQNRRMERDAQAVKDLLLHDNRLSDLFDMDLNELYKLHDLCLKGKDIESICMSFNYGFSMGMKASETMKATTNKR